jgi:simple sugar transport system ATP-binding protein
MEENYAIELKNVSKRFGEVIANDGVNLRVEKGEILSILGENGSGKTTLMNMLSGIYYPDEGQIFMNGQEVTIRSPKDAFDLKIGMIHQHFKVIDILTATENIMLGMDEEKLLNFNRVKSELEALTSRYGFELDLDKKIYNMSVSEKQTVEIVKVLYRGADILILDEPTAVLTPQEANKLFAVLRNMKEAGKSIIIITHKLQEVLDLSDRVAILRKGKYIGTVHTADSDVSSLTEMMVGEKISLDINRTEPKHSEVRLEVEHLTCINSDRRKVVNDVTFTARSGEILGIAGVSGCGMKQLLEAIAGLQEHEFGKIRYINEQGEIKDIARLSAKEMKKQGVNISFVPEDRLGMGLVADMGITENMMLRGYEDRKSIFIDRSAPRKMAKEIVEHLKVVTPSIETPVRRLSGGNIQKILVGREILLNPSILMVAYPVRGLDINSSYTIYNLLNEQKEKGVIVICVIEDLDVLLALSDKIVVLNNGKMTGIREARTTSKEEIGILMTKNIEGGSDENECESKEKLYIS